MKKFLAVLVTLALSIAAHAKDVKAEPPAADSAAAAVLKYWQLIHDGKLEDAKAMETASIQQNHGLGNNREKEQNRTRSAQTDKMFRYAELDKEVFRKSADIMVVIRSEDAQGHTLDFNYFMKKIDGKWFVCDSQGK